MGQYEHMEAFCLFKYRDELGNEEVIWNSRDGVIPFAVPSRVNPLISAYNRDWAWTNQAPFYIPKVGERVFVNLTPERTLARVSALVRENWGWMARMKQFAAMTETQAIAFLASGYDYTEPDVVTVDKALQDVFFHRSRLARQTGGRR